MKKAIIALLFCFLGSIETYSQELNCTVVLRTDQLFAQQSNNDNTLGQLQGIISDFINARRWTADIFSAEERINCKITINLLRSPAIGIYEGNAQIVVTRPVYGSNYETVVFSFIDRDFNFGYLPNNPMYFNENAYSDELTHLLGFYAYVILAADYDSFSKEGGTAYIQKAFNLTNLAQNTSVSGGWKAGPDTRNRYWLIENLMNQQLLPFRDAQYNYHRLGLDIMTENPLMARRQIIEALNTVNQVAQIRGNSVLINSFFDAKSEELYKALLSATKEERQKSYTVLSQLDPTKTELYRKLVK